MRHTFIVPFVAALSLVGGISGTASVATAQTMDKSSTDAAHSHSTYFSVEINEESRRGSVRQYRFECTGEGKLITKIVQGEKIYEFTCLPKEEPQTTE